LKPVDYPPPPELSSVLINHFSHVEDNNGVVFWHSSAYGGRGVANRDRYAKWGLKFVENTIDKEYEIIIKIFV
jgi:hypothetical protein